VGKRKKPKQFITVESWPEDEISTRNCHHCLAPKEGVYVRCRQGRQMVAEYYRHLRQLTYNGVIRYDGLLKLCRNCPDFDNDWRLKDDVPFADSHGPNPEALF